jgi:hypothetical protein
MTDTPAHIYQKQQEIWLAKSLEERLRLTCDMADFAYFQTISFIKKQNPDANEAQIKRIFVETYYPNEVHPSLLEQIYNQP